ncbi:toprim domain-containing protein [Bifidobacterium thermacidophilum]|uniref:toprim domain-containing protein n=1 Tax=Bifidobacterium thermacidophilum TaxID=246618 RepID=UPI0004179620|nr:toprim domain-containing protein [Bifidobacterium thermacidophilum]
MSGITSIRRVLDAAAGHGLKVRQNHADDYMMQCPLHTPDDDPSVHVTYRDGRTLICDMHDPNDTGLTGQIVEAISLTLNDLYDEPLEAGEPGGYFDNRYDRWIREWAAKQAHSLAGERHTETIAPTVGAPYAMPAPYVPSNTLPALPRQFKDICASLGITEPCCGPVWAECPVCGREGGLQVLYSPYERATLLCCRECGGGRDYADKLMDMLRVPASDYRSNGTEIMAYDTPQGVTYTYPDGAKVHRRPDKRINSTGAAGAHPLWRSHEAAEYMPGHPVFLTEGEKDAATLWAMGYPAMSGIGGAGAFAHRVSLDNIRGALAGATVVAVVDKDESGLKWARQVRDKLAPVVGTLTFVQAHGKAHDTTDTVMTHDMRTEWFDTLLMPASATPPDTPGDTDTGGTPDTDTVHHADTGMGKGMDTDAGSVMDADDDGMDTRVDPDTGFWEAARWLTRIRDTARGQQRSPWLLLCDTMSLVSAALPPNVVTTMNPYSRGGGPLYGYGPVLGHNLFVAAVGNAGEGKGSTYGIARRLFPDLHGALTIQPASGEGVVSSFVKWEQIKAEDGKTANVPVCDHGSVLLRIPEVRNLGAAMGRQNSTLLPTLTSAWSNEDIGGKTRHDETSLTVPSFGYTLNAIVDVQPSNAGILFDGEGTGLPQRFVWSDARDPYGLDHKSGERITPLIGDTSWFPTIDPAVLSRLYQYGSIGRLLEEQDDTGNLHRWAWWDMYPPREAIAYVERRNAETNRHGLADPFMAHTDETRFKVAMLLPFCDPDRTDRHTITSQDWELSGAIMEHSDKVRRECQEQWEAKAVNDAARKARFKRAGERKARETESELKATAAEKVLTFLNKPKNQGRTVDGNTIKNGITQKYREYVADALADLETAGKLECVELRGSLTASIWRLAD